MGSDAAFALLLAAVAGFAISIGSVFAMMGSGSTVTGSSSNPSSVARHKFCATGNVTVFRPEIEARGDESEERCR